MFHRRMIRRIADWWAHRNDVFVIDYAPLARPKKRTVIVDLPMDELLAAPTHPTHKPNVRVLPKSHRNGILRAAVIEMHTAAKQETQQHADFWYPEMAEVMALPPLPMNSRHMAQDIAADVQDGQPSAGEFVGLLDRLSLMPCINQASATWPIWRAHALAQVLCAAVDTPQVTQQTIAQCKASYTPMVAILHINGPAPWGNYHRALVEDHLAAVMASALGFPVSVDHAASEWTNTSDPHRHGWEAVLQLSEQEGEMAA